MELQNDLKYDVAQPPQLQDNEINTQLVCVTGSDNSVHSKSKYKNKSVSLTYSFLPTLVTYSTFYKRNCHFCIIVIPPNINSYGLHL